MHLFVVNSSACSANDCLSICFICKADVPTTYYLLAPALIFNAFASVISLFILASASLSDEISLLGFKLKLSFDLAADGLNDRLRLGEEGYYEGTLMDAVKLPDSSDSTPKDLILYNTFSIASLSFW